MIASDDIFKYSFRFSFNGVTFNFVCFVCTAALIVQKAGNLKHIFVTSSHAFYVL